MTVRREDDSGERSWRMTVINHAAAFIVRVLR